MILAIDQGTTGTTCLVFDDDPRIVGRAYSEFEQHFPRPGWVEHDATEIWETTRRVAGEALADAGIGGGELDAIGITNQRETVVAWDPADGEPIHRALVWQDRRTAARCDELRAAGREDLVRERTGLVLDPYFSGTKIEWLLRNVEGAERAVFGTIDSWLLFKLTGRHATDRTNASRTMLFDIRSHDWDEELCAMLGVDPGRLPEPLPSSQVFGTTTEFGGEVPVAGIAGDQQAALFGQACIEAGSAKNTYGTGSFVLLHTGADLPGPVSGLLSTVACETGGSPAYALEASIFVTGAAIQWLRDGLGIVAEAGETEGLAASLEGNDGVYFVPALTGLGSPHWDPYARGTIVGLTRGRGGPTSRARRWSRSPTRRSTPSRRRRRRPGSVSPSSGPTAAGSRTVADAVPGGRARRAGGRARDQRDDRTRRRLPGRDRDRALERGGRPPDLARVRPLRAGDGRRPARHAAGRMAAGARALARLGSAAAGRVTATTTGGRQGDGRPRPTEPCQRSSHRSTRTSARRSTSTSSMPRAAEASAGPTRSSACSSPLPTLLLYRTRAIGLENVPRSGPLILAPNHFSQMDHFFIGLYLRRQIRFMAKSQLFGPPVLTYIFKHGGVIPIRRGHHDEVAFETAYTVLGQGGMLLIYAEGGRSRSGELGQPKPGVGRLALESGAPVVPVAIHGSASVRRWKRLSSRR